MSSSAASSFTSCQTASTASATTACSPAASGSRDRNARRKQSDRDGKPRPPGSLAHFGTYTVNEADKTLIFRIEGSTYPSWDGTEQKRVFTLTGDELKYTVPTVTIGAGTSTVVWKQPNRALTRFVENSNAGAIRTRIQRSADVCPAISILIRVRTTMKVPR